MCSGSGVAWKEGFLCWLTRHSATHELSLGLLSQYSTRSGSYQLTRRAYGFLQIKWLLWTTLLWLQIRLKHQLTHLLKGWGKQTSKVGKSQKWGFTTRLLVCITTIYSTTSLHYYYSTCWGWKPGLLLLGLPFIDIGVGMGSSSPKQQDSFTKTREK